MALQSVAGDILIVQPTVNKALYQNKVGTSTNKENIPGFVFPDDKDQFLDVFVWIHGYNNVDGIRVQAKGIATGADTNTGILECACRRMEGEDITASHTYSYDASSTVTFDATNNKPQLFTLDFTHAQLDGVTDGDLALFRFSRIRTDTHTGDLLILPLFKFLQR